MAKCEGCPLKDYDTADPALSEVTREVIDDLTHRVAEARLSHFFVLGALEAKKRAQERWIKEEKIDNLAFLERNGELLGDVGECVKTKMSGRCGNENLEGEEVLQELVSRNAPFERG